jgi:ribosomal subunit interface protein
MAASPTYSFRHVQRSAVLEERVRELMQRLQRYNERIDQCHLTVERLGADRGGPTPYEVRIDLSIPGAEIHAGGTSDSGARQNDVFVALNEAFNDAKRQLQQLQCERIGIPTR